MTTHRTDDDRPLTVEQLANELRLLDAIVAREPLMSSALPSLLELRARLRHEMARARGAHLIGGGR